MDEKPKSIWKKSWTGWRGLLLGWLALMIATLIIFLVLMFVIGAGFAGDELKLWAALSFCATLIIFLVLFIHWLCCWRNFKRFLFGCACLATLIALFYAEEDWRGKRDWEKFKRAEEAKGEKLDFKDFVPAPVPDDQNFAMAPVFDATDKLASRKWRNEHRNQHPDSRGNPWDTNLVDRLQIDIGRNNDWPTIHSTTNGTGDWQTAETSDLKIWQHYYRTPATTTNEFPTAPQPQTPAQDVLLALSKYDPTIEELRQASQRPDSRFPLDYDDEDPAEILLPHLAALKRSSQVLQLRAIAELQNNESQKALDDVKLSLRLVDSVRTEPFLISHLVRIAILQITLQPVYEGLAEHKWSDAQLAVLDEELAKPDFVADYLKIQKSEIYFSAEEANFLRRHRDYASVFTEMDINYPHNYKFEFAVYRFMPGGWFYQSALKNGRTQMEYLTAVNHDAMTISPALTRQADLATRDAMSFFDPLDTLRKMFNEGDFMGNFAEKVAHGQTSANLARVAIALERYRLAHGEFPETLDALAPQFMEKVPHDVIGGQPLHYRRTDDPPSQSPGAAGGQFVLYSVGWNETDDGGVVAFEKGSSPQVDIGQGDWVWRYPQK